MYLHITLLLLRNHQVNTRKDKHKEQISHGQKRECVCEWGSHQGIKTVIKEGIERLFFAALGAEVPRDVPAAVGGVFVGVRVIVRAGEEAVLCGCVCVCRYRCVSTTTGGLVGDG
jgi:hypothetical protein